MVKNAVRSASLHYVLYFCFINDRTQKIGFSIHDITKLMETDANFQKKYFFHKKVLTKKRTCDIIFKYV